jgi:hypothetical protein
LVGLFITINPWGYSYMHWLNRWVVWGWNRTPAVPQDLQVQLFAFVMLGCAGAYGYVFFLYHKQCKGFVQFFIWRIALTAALSFALFNPWMGYATWGHWWWNTLLPVWPWKLAFWQIAEIAIMSLAGAILIMGWHYVLKKAWQGVGSSKLTAGLVIVLAAAFLWVLNALGLSPSNARAMLGIIEFMTAVAIGICFSLTLIDRFFSGTVSSTTTIKEIDVSHDGGHQVDDSILAQDEHAGATPVHHA